MKKKVFEELTRQIAELTADDPAQPGVPPPLPVDPTSSEGLAAQYKQLTDKLGRYRRVQAQAAARFAAQEQSDPVLTDPASDFEACDEWSTAGDHLMRLAERMARKCIQVEAKLEYVRVQRALSLENDKSNAVGLLAQRYHYLESIREAVPPLDPYYSIRPYEWKAQIDREMSALRMQIDAARGVIDGATVRLRA